MNRMEFQIDFSFKKAVYFFGNVVYCKYLKMLFPLVSVANRNPQEVSTDI